MSISIKHKFTIASILIFISVVTILAISQLTTLKLKSFETIEVDIHKTAEDMLELQRIEKDFLITSHIQDQELFNQTVDKTKKDLIHFEKALIKVELDSNLIKQLGVYLEEYQSAFNKMIELQKIIGLSPTDGIYGDLQQAEHRAEKTVKATNNSQLHTDILQLLANEKDFMLYNNIKYFQQFEKNLAEFNLHLKKSSLNKTQISKIKASLNDYSKTFKALVDASVTQGLTSSQGLKGEVRDAVTKSEKTLKEINNQLESLIIEEIGSVDSLLIKNDIIAAVLIIAITLVLYLLSRSVLQPIDNFVEVIEHIANDNNLKLRSEVKSDDEIGQMSKSFNKMIEKLQSIIDNVNESSEQVTVATDEIKTISGINENNLAKQKNQTEHVAISMHKMSQTVLNIADSALKAADCANDANSESQSGKEIVNISEQTIKNIASQIKVASDSISRVENDSDRIGSVLEVIRGIADQTNLLALNAAIEAARAGEQGRGFAVVADEVRTLASRTQESTQEIQEMVESLQSGTKEAVSLMKDSQEGTQKGVEQADKAGEALESIVVAVKKITEMNTEIATTAKQQGAVSDEIDKNIHTIRELNDQSLSNAQEFISSSDQIVATVAGLSHSVKQFK